MAYRIEGKDLVIDGFESGIGASPHQGIADMRNIDITTVPGEASVSFRMQDIIRPPVMNGVNYTAQASANTITVSSTDGLYAGCAVSLSSNTAGGLTNGVVYYVQNITGTTFQLSVALLSTTPVDISSDGSGTLTTYQYGDQAATSNVSPLSYFVDERPYGDRRSIYITDASGYIWQILQYPFSILQGNSLYFMGNITFASAQERLSFVAIWKQYIFKMSANGYIDVALLSNITSNNVQTAWTYRWNNGGSIGSNQFDAPQGLVSKVDGNLYWITIQALGSLIETAGSAFNPSDADTYTLLPTALDIDQGFGNQIFASCLAELGENILIGTTANVIFLWNRLDNGTSNTLNIPDGPSYKIVASDQNAYIFAGRQGRIYITNGSGVSEYMKVSDYLSGVMRPYIVWGDANLYRNKLLFAAQAYTHTSQILPTMAGAWSIDLKNDALCMIQKTTRSDYAGRTPMICPTPSGLSFTNIMNPNGMGVTLGWTSSGPTAYGLSSNSPDPYINWESYIEADLVPVGTYLDPFSPSQIEWKTSAPLAEGEGIRIFYRNGIAGSWTLVGSTEVVGGNTIGTTTGTTQVYPISDYYQANFEKVQWLSLRIEMKSAHSNPSFCRLVEIRIRDWPSGKNAR